VQAGHTPAVKVRPLEKRHTEHDMRRMDEHVAEQTAARTDGTCTTGAGASHQSQIPHTRATAQRPPLVPARSMPAHPPRCRHIPLLADLVPSRLRGANHAAHVIAWVRASPPHGHVEHDRPKPHPHRLHCCPRLHWLEPPASPACACDSHHLAVDAGRHPSWLLETDRHWRTLFGGAQLQGGAWTAWHVSADGDGRKKRAGRLASPGNTAGGRG